MQTMVPTAGSQPAVVPVAEPAEPDDLSAGDRAGPWIVDRELGRGGMGSVYAVTHEGIGKRAALKVMHRRLIAGSSAERILQEARVVNQVGHPNIVDIFETGALEDGRPYIVMERLEGMPLSYRADEGKILPDLVISILLQVCDALIAAHAANIVHRDLKLDNVFLIDNPDDPAQPKVKLLDWGIAKIISNDVRHTIEGQLVGTPQYLSPEQARGGVVSPQTDVYSLGVMAYELFLEELPFEAETSAEIMAMHLRAVPPRPSELWPDIPPNLENLLLGMLEKDPESRPTMLTIAHTLEQVRSDLRARRDEKSEPIIRISPPPHTAFPRLESFSGLAPTEPASSAAWRKPNTRWHVAVGAFAVALAAAMFLLSRAPEMTAAAAKPPASEATADSTDTAPSAPADTKADVEIAQPAAPAAPATPPALAPVVTSRATPAKPRRHYVIHKAPAKPRRDADHDPDGTIDPYQ